MCSERILMQKMKNKLKAHQQIKSKNKKIRKICSLMIMKMKMMIKIRKLILISCQEMLLPHRRNMMKIERIKNLMMMMKIIVFNILRRWLKLKTKKRKIEKMKYGNTLQIDTAKKNLSLFIKQLASTRKKDFQKIASKKYLKR